MAAPAAAPAELGHEDDGLALLTRVETLAEDTAGRLARGAHAEAVEVLRHAYGYAGGADEGIVNGLAMDGAQDGTSHAATTGLPVVGLARAGVCLLLCAVLGGAGSHSEALRAARAAEAEMCEVWWALVAAAAPAGPAAASAKWLLGLLRAPPAPWLGQAAATSVQAKHALALELESTTGSALEVERLQLEGALLAEHLLADGHPVRRRAAAAWQEWHGRQGEVAAGAGAGADGALGAAGLRPVAPGQQLEPDRARPSELLRMLLGPRAPVALALGTVEEEQDDEEPLLDLPRFAPRQGSRATTAPLPKHERMYLGLPPAVDLNWERRRRRAPLLASSHSEGSLLGTSGFSTSSSSASAGQPSSTWGARSAPQGDILSRSCDWGPDGLPAGRSWACRRRVPVLFEMAGSGGKASWALRSGAGSTLGRRGPKINPFQDWLKTASGDAKPLKAQVLESAQGQEDFYHNMREQSRRFKHFWLKEEVTGEALAEDRILFCAEGMALKRKQGRAASIRAAALVAGVAPATATDGVASELPGALRERSSQAVATRTATGAPRTLLGSVQPERVRKEATRALFGEYGLKCPSSEPGLRDMRKLLAASNARALEAFAEPGTAAAPGGRGRPAAPAAPEARTLARH